MSQHTQGNQDPAIARYTLRISTSSGYESTTDGECTAHQYSMAIAALHGAPHTSQELIAQRDELLQALKLLMASEPLISAATDAELESGLDDEDETTRTQANAWLVARAAIKKAEGA